MDSKFGDLSNKIAEMHPMRNGTIVTLSWDAQQRLSRYNSTAYLFAYCRH